ncbi:MAG: hypothetical protein GEV13_23850 [Rhodospirillales bacterium]|nr:hypothetical protein [Rhodospirillales bacterium]
MHVAIRAAALGLLAAATLTLSGEASAQSYGVPAGPKIGEMEVKAYQGIPKTKVAVQLTSDTHLSRELRRQVMIRLSKRGNEVGFSGGNVMRMDVSYFDFSDSGRGDYGTQGGQPSYAPPGSNPRMDLPSNTIRRRDGLGSPTSVPTLRITLTLYSKDGGKVLWTASGSCATQADKAQTAGEAIINRIFDSADKSLTGDAGCPL